MDKQEKIVHLETDIATGLTSAQVEAKIAANQTNKTVDVPSRTIGDIIKTNTLTLFNALNAILAILVIIAGQPRNALFAFVIVANTFIGIFQELRAKYTLEKLSVLNTFQVPVVRDGQTVTIDTDEIVLDDIMKLSTGMQIAVDAIVRSGEIEVDESLLTGEADPVLKHVGDELLSGSFVVSGSCDAQAIRVAKDMYASKLSAEAKRFSMVDSELRKSVNQIIKIVTYLILPVGAMLMFTQLFFNNGTWQDALVGAVGGIIGMIPEGLVLLTSVALMVGVIRLAQKKTLVQEMPAIEMLARVDVLCLDKTGTITEGNLKLAEIELTGDKDQMRIDDALAVLTRTLPAANPTQMAIYDYYQDAPAWDVTDTVAFSSARKWSAASFNGEGTWIIGAPEMVLGNDYNLFQEKVEEQARLGRRVLVLAHSQSAIKDEQLPADTKAEAFIMFEDIIRNHANKTLAYFASQGVSLKVISGDNPVTVAAVAKRAGLEGADQYIDARTLPDDIESLQEIVAKTTVFGRVSPQQKQKLVQALQANGHTVAMTGDGVNDVLALKESDCGIAMANGSEATRSVAQLVLLNSDFASLPQVVSEGRRVINNIERVSSLYLVKTLYSIILSVVFTILLKPYPFLPLQLTLIGSVATGIPSFFLALAPNGERVTGGFLRKVAQDTIPGGIAVAIGTLIIYGLSSFMHYDVEQRRTMAILVAGGVQLVVLLRVARPWKAWNLTLVGIMVVIFFATFFLPVISAIFYFVPMNWFDYLIGGILIIASWWFMNFIQWFMNIIYDRWLLIRKDKA